MTSNVEGDLSLSRLVSAANQAESGTVEEALAVRPVPDRYIDWAKANPDLQEPKLRTLAFLILEAASSQQTKHE
ncbi:MAG TPA: hypothetical protein VLF88_01015 [Candidatus Babeliales bacterium]|nr:hypothetical protein [Candidatus Babeliales bacterium]